MFHEKQARSGLGFLKLILLDESENGESFAGSPITAQTYLENRNR